MGDRHAAPDLRPLENAYTIIGELRGDDDARTFLAKRAAGDDEVLITVVREPGSDGNNALNHFAADTKLLAGLAHPNMPRVLDGRWLGKDAFAIVTARPAGDTLGELLSRDERLSFPRIASVLQDVKGVLDWARDNGVVHRGVTADSLVFERDSDQVLVSLLPTPIGIDAVPGACDDARTIGRLARAMLTGEPPQGEARLTPIADVRPDLARRVAEETDAMTSCANPNEAPDVSAYIGVIAMAQSLKDGEETVARLQAEFAAEQAAERERFDNEMDACRRDAADQAAEFAAERDAARKRIEEQQTQLTAERAQYDQERIEFDEAREELERQRTAFAAEHAAFERERDDWNQERESLEQRLAAGEQMLAEERAQRESDAERARAEIERARAEAQRSAADAEAVAVPVLTELAVREAVEKSRQGNRDKKSRTPETEVPIETGAETRSVAIKTAAPSGAQWEKAPPSISFQKKAADAESGGETSSDAMRRWPWITWRPSWTKPTALVAALVLLGASIAVARHENSHNSVDSVALGGTKIDPRLPTLDTTSMPRGGFLTQSAGGRLAVGGTGAPLATGVDSPSGTAPDSSSSAVVTAAQVSAGDVAPSAVTPVPTPMSTPRSTPISTPQRQPATQPSPNPAPAAPRPLGPRASAPIDTTATTASTRAPVTPTPPPIDTTRHDSIIPLRMPLPRRDSSVHRDTAVRHDTASHDTTRTRPDTSSGPAQSSPEGWA